MLLKSNFKVDLFQLKHTKDPAALLDAMKQANAADLGRKLIEMFPYEKIAAFGGDLPEMSLNKDHEFTDTWGVELVVLTKTQAEFMRNVCRRGGMPEETINNFL